MTRTSFTENFQEKRGALWPKETVITINYSTCAPGATLFHREILLERELQSLNSLRSMRTNHGVRTVAHRALMGERAFARALSESASVCVHVKFPGARDSRIKVDADVARPNRGFNFSEHFRAVAVSRFLALCGLGVAAL